MSTAWTTAVGTSVAELLTAEDVCQWNPDGLYPANQVGSFVGLMPDQPADAVGIIATPLTPGDGVAQLRIQVRVRRNDPDPRDTNDLAQAVVDVLHERRNVILGGTRVPLLRLQSWGDLGYDQANRPEVSLNFYGYAAYATPAFRD